MGSLGTWAWAETAACASSESQKPAFIRAAKNSEHAEKGLHFGLKELWVESVLLLVAGRSMRHPTLSGRGLAAGNRTLTRVEKAPTLLQQP